MNNTSSKLTTTPSGQSAPGQSAPGQLAAGAHNPAYRWMLPILLIGQAMATLDTSIANVAAPAISHDLGISGAWLQLVIAGYLLPYAALLITGARLGDDFGYRRAYLLGVAIFTLASLACGLAPGAMTLIIARVVQGLGAAMMVPQVLSLIQRHFEGQSRARAVGLYSMILALGVTAGQLLGGIIVSANLLGLSWRPAFLINVPVGIALLLLARHALPDSRGSTKRKFDFLGVATLATAMLLIIVALTFGHGAGWPAWVWLCLAAGVSALGGLFVVEKAVARQGGSPLIDFDAIAAPGIASGLMVIFIGFVGYGGMLFAMAMYMQQGLGFSPLASGLAFTAYSLGFGVANLRWSKLPPALLRKVPTMSLLLLALAHLLFGLSAWSLGWSPWLMMPLLLLAGTGHGFAFGPVVNQIAARMQAQHAPILGGLVSTSTQLSIVLGIATLGTLYLVSAGQLGGSGAASHAIATVAFANALAALLASLFAFRLARSHQS